MKQIYLLSTVLLVIASFSVSRAQDPNFFPIGVYMQSPSNAQAYKNIGINLYIQLHEGLTQDKLNALTAANMKFIVEPNEFSWTQINNPLIYAWGQMDEPDNAQETSVAGTYGPCVPPDTINYRYNLWKTRDPSRPVFLNLGQGVSYTTWGGRGVCTNNLDTYRYGKNGYTKGTDIVSFDIYPVNYPDAAVNNKLWMVPKGVDSLHSWSENRKKVWAIIETTKISASQVRRPTISEVRSEVWMAIVHGATGIGYFCHKWDPFDEAAMLHDAEMAAGVSSINSQVQGFAPILNSATTAGYATVSTNNTEFPVDILTKNYQDFNYLFAVGMRNGQTTATFTVGSGTIAEVIGENRSIPIINGKFTDQFAPFQTHFYKISTVVPVYTPYTVLTTQTPNSITFSSAELGMRFRSTENGPVSKIRYYKVPGESGTHTGKLWSAAGTLLASVTFTNETASGWQEAKLATPYNIVANTDYVVSVNSVSRYGATGNGFASVISNGPLKSAAGSNGVFGSPGAFPTYTFNKTNYFRDVVFLSSSVDITPPSVPTAVNATGTTPTSTILSWTASSDNIAVTGYDVFKDSVYLHSVTGPGDTITGLKAATTYTFTVKAKDAAGNYSAASTPRSVTTQQWPAGSYTILTTQVPAGGYTDGPYEMGTRFKTTVDGKITKVRFYKVAGDEGTQTRKGHIWSVSGTELAAVVFSGETASGWQEATLATPLNIKADTEYVVSVNTLSNYGARGREFEVEVGNGPLKAIVGGNGVYNTTVGVKPASSYNNTNYFRDVVFEFAGQTPGGGGNPGTDPGSGSNRIRIYPNPSDNGHFTIDLGKGYTNTTIQLIDLVGRVAYTQALPDNQPVVEVNANVRRGIYFLKIISNGKALSILKLLLVK